MNHQVNSLIGPSAELDAPRFQLGQSVKVVSSWGACPNAVGVIRSFGLGMYVVEFRIRGARHGNAWTFFPRWLSAA